MRVVLDTNVLVSSLLSQGPPAQILEQITSGQLTLLIDDRILFEYREVLKRPKFHFEEVKVDELIAFLDRFGEYVSALLHPHLIPDPGDIPFLEVALTGKAEVLITGNKRDYGPPPRGLKILTPSEFLDYYRKLF